jgi:hypothetical protein
MPNGGSLAVGCSPVCNGSPVICHLLLVLHLDSASLDGLLAPETGNGCIVYASTHDQANKEP